MVLAVLGAVPALPLHEAGKYVAGAFVVLFVLVLAYLAIMTARVGGIERELAGLLDRQQRRAEEEESAQEEQVELARPESSLA